MTRSWEAVEPLGAGLGYREPFRAELFLHRSRVDFLEITADHYLDPSPEKERELELLAANFTLVPHALELSLGSAEGLDPLYLRKLAALVRKVDPPYWSEHAAFTRAGGIDLGHLHPLPLTREAVEVVARNTAAVREWIPAPLILENITSTLDLPGAEMEEPEFLRALAERTGCGLLLDATNLWINCLNRGRDPHAFLERLPLEWVVQLHFAGGRPEGAGMVDSHSAPVPPPVWELMEAVLSRAPVRGVILERDEALPPLTELLEEVDRARELGRRYGRWP